jgi:hypothetical protein
MYSDGSSEFRIDKSRREATLTLSNGASVPGCFFVSASSRTHAGPERIKDVLNGEAGFVPFEVADGANSATVLYNREHIIFVELSGSDEPHTDPGYDVAAVRSVTMLLSNGVHLRGQLRVYRPKGSDRLSDFARTPETFGYLEGDTATYLVNVRHVVQLNEETSPS